MKQLRVYSIWDEECWEKFILITGPNPRFGQANEDKEEVGREHAAEILRTARTVDEDGHHPATITRIANRRYHEAFNSR